MADEQISLLDTAALADAADVGELVSDGEAVAGDDPTLLGGPSAVQSLGVRARAVAYTRPLHELEANKRRLGGEAWARLNLIELGFHAIDVAALRMDFDSGARHDDVISAVAALARQQEPALEDARRVGDRVLEGLITGRGGGDAEAHQASYGSWGPDGYVAKRFDYALMTEHVDEAGEFYLRVTDPAISVLMGALEVDVESAQVASEVRINELVRRGLLAAAIQEAQRAKYRTIQYTNLLQRRISQARTNTTGNGALTAVGELVDEALAHVLDRYKAERAILDNVTEARNEASDPAMRRRANLLIAELDQCQLRHQRLQKRLLRARTEFRHAHAEQLAAGPATPSGIDLERQLLAPALRAPVLDADALALISFRFSTAPLPPPLVDLEQLAGALCAVPQPLDEVGERVDDEDELVEAADRRRFTDDVWDAVDTILEGVEAPTRLSALIRQAERDGLDEDLFPEDVEARVHLLALRAMHGLDPALSEHLRQLAEGGEPEGRLLWWQATGEPFEAPGLEGDDLAVQPAWLVAGRDAHSAGGRSEGRADGDEDDG